PQLYLGYPAGAVEPPKVLRGFDDVGPHARGASQRVVMTIGEREMNAVWDTPSQSRVRPARTFAVFVGASSRDIRLTGSF
ncbi:hypothetical protein GGX14DRAFT_376379, partial [Mycena pura]